MDEAEPGLAERTADVVSAYVANNALHISQLPELIVSVHAALKRLSAPGPIEAERPEPPVPSRSRSRLTSSSVLRMAGSTSH